MHRRSLTGRLTSVVGTLVSVLAAPVLALSLIACCASTVGAADVDAPPPPPPLKKIERIVGEKAATEKAVDEKAAVRKETGEKAAGEKGGMQPVRAKGDKESEPTGKSGKKADVKASGEKAAVEKPAHENAASEKPAAEKPIEEKGFGEEPVNPRDKESVLLWLYHSMGKRYVVIFLGVTFNEIALVVMIVLGLRRKNLCPLSLVTEFEERLNKKEYQEAYELAKGNNSFLGKILAAGMANLSDGHEAALESMHEVGEEQNMRMEQRNGHIALIAQISPMLGLLATVDGIVRAFAVIAGSDVTPKPSQLAQGIGIALVNTVVGLWLAIPSIVFYHLIRNRLTRLVLEVGVVSSRLMKRFSNVSVAVKKS